VIDRQVADIGHSTLPTPIHVLWVEQLQEELFTQGDKERNEGLPVSPLMDRNEPGPAHPDNQIGFFKVMVLPMLSAWVEAFPECEPLLRQAEANFQHWMSKSTRRATSMDETGRRRDSRGMPFRTRARRSRASHEFNTFVSGGSGSSERRVINSHSPLNLQHDASD
jgi:hypothetical protein